MPPPALAALYSLWLAAKTPLNFAALGLRRDPTLASPLDYTATARGQHDPNPEYVTYRLPGGLAQTNRGRVLFGDDARHFRDLERGDFGAHMSAYNADPRRFRGQTPAYAPPVEIARRPGEGNLPMNAERTYALLRLAQAAASGLIDEIPTPADRDPAAVWRQVSGDLSGTRNLTSRLRSAPRNDLIDLLQRWKMVR